MISLLQATPLFANLSEQEMASIMEIAEQQWVGRNTRLFRQGDQGTTFYVIISGSVKIYHEGPDGKEKIITILRTGDSFGELSILDGETRSASAATLEDSLFLTISLDSFHHLLERNFAITFKIIQQLVTRLRKTNQQVMDLVFLDAKGKIFKTLLTLASQHGTRQGDIITLSLFLNEREIANVAGVSEEVTSTVIKDLMAKGIVSFQNQQLKLNLSLLNKS